jgi:hypothetical protein
MNEKINLAEKFALLARPYEPVNTGDAGGAMTAEPRLL